MAALWSKLFNKHGNSLSQQSKTQAENARFLSKLQQSRTRLKAQLAHQIGSTLVLKVDPVKQLVFIDEFDNRLLNAEIELPKTIRLSGQHQGVPVDFKAELFFRGEAKGYPFYVFKLPTQSVYIQRRRIYRVPMELGANIQILIQNEQGQHFQGKVTDISASGVQARFEKLLKDQVPLHHPVSAVLTIDRTQLPLALDLRHMAPQNDGQQVAVRAGGIFANTNNAVQRQLEQMIVNLQRDKARDQLA